MNYIGKEKCKICNEILYNCELENNDIICDKCFEKFIMN